MIIGIGSDIVNIPRIERLLAIFGTRFEARVFTPAERFPVSRDAERGSRAAASHYAKRFAAKEAFLKALGTGLRQNMALKDIAIINDAYGKPELVLSGAARRQLEALAPQDMYLKAHVTLADDYPTAQAFVILESIKF